MVCYHLYCWIWIDLAYAIDDFGSEVQLSDSQFERAVSFKLSEVH
ncbi:hypothetical protein ACFSHT_15750 [Paraburkholderia silviterrae]|nr:hypothetical protein [Paraburkholderia silviterrae]